MSRSLHRRATGAILLLALAGCSRGGEETAEKSPVTAVTTEASTTTTQAPAPPPARFILLGLQSGDAACYVHVRNVEGGEDYLPGAFELCPGESADASAYVGQRVHLERRPDRIMADSCQGDPACRQTQPVNLVVAVKPAH